MELTNLDDVMNIVGTGDDDIISAYLRLHDTGFNEIKHSSSIKARELFDLSALIELIKTSGKLTDDIANGYALGYRSTPGGLSEQFDILRFGKNDILNIELKSSMPNSGVDGIKRQLLRHRLYLGVLNKDVETCCFLNDSSQQIYHIDEKGNFGTITPIELIEIMHKTDSGKHLPLEINLSTMIISPYVEPQKFTNHQFFLNDEQYKARDGIVNSKQNKIIVKGAAGSGKTLVLVDAARKLQQLGKRVMILFCSPMSNYKDISASLGIEIVPVRQFNVSDIAEKRIDVLLVDESQRLYQHKLDALLSLNNVKIVFSFDRTQTLHPDEERLSFHSDVIQNKDFSCFSLKGKVRADPALASFVRKFLYGSKAGVHPYVYDKVSVHYSCTEQNASQYIFEKQSEGYVVIEPTPYYTKSTNTLKRQKISDRSLDVHQTIGREYDNVVVVVDQYYSCDQNGLKGTYNTYYPYKEKTEIFEAMTRVRKHLVLLIVDNVDVYTFAQQIMTWYGDKEHQQQSAENKLQKEIQQFDKKVKCNQSVSDAFNLVVQGAAKLSVDSNVSLRALLDKIQAQLTK